MTPYYCHKKSQLSHITNIINFFRKLLTFYLIASFSSVYVKVRYESDGQKRTAPFDHFQFRWSHFEPQLDEEINGLDEVRDSTLIDESTLSKGMKCFALWQDNRYYSVMIMDIQKNVQSQKRKGKSFLATVQVISEKFSVNMCNLHVSLLFFSR